MWISSTCTHFMYPPTKTLTQKSQSTSTHFISFASISFHLHPFRCPGVVGFKLSIESIPILKLNPSDGPALDVVPGPVCLNRFVWIGMFRSVLLQLVANTDGWRHEVHRIDPSLVCHSSRLTGQRSGPQAHNNRVDNWTLELKIGLKERPRWTVN